MTSVTNVRYIVCVAIIACILCAGAAAGGALWLLNVQTRAEMIAAIEAARIATQAATREAHRARLERKDRCMNSMTLIRGVNVASRETPTGTRTHGFDVGTCEVARSVVREGQAECFVLVEHDDRDALQNGPIARAYRLAHKFGGPNMTGGRIAAEFSAIHTATDRQENEVKQGVALTGSAYGWAAGGWGGTTEAPRGALYGGNSIVTTIRGYTNTENITSHEFNTQMEKGSSTHYKSGIQVVSRDQVHATGPDVGVAVSSTNGAVGFNYGLSFGDMNGGPPVGSNGTLIGDYTRLGGAHTAAVGIDFTHWLFTQYLMRFKTWALLPSGSLSMGNGAGQVHIDGRSHKWGKGSLNSFDTRLSFSGGQDGIDGGGIASVFAALFSVNAKMEVANVPGVPDTNNHWTISMDRSGAYLRWKDEKGDEFILKLGRWAPARTAPN